MTKRIMIVSLSLLVLAFASTACNTVRGAGEDVQSVGDTVRANSP